MDVVGVLLANVRHVVRVAMGLMDPMLMTAQQRTDVCVQRAARAADDQPLAHTLHAANDALEVQMDMRMIAAPSVFTGLDLLLFRTDTVHSLMPLGS